MENKTVFLIVAGGLAGFTILNILGKNPDILNTLKNDTPRVDYWNKGQNSTAKKINRTNLFSYFQPAYQKKNWTGSATKADKAKVLTATHAENPKKRETAAKKVVTHMLRTGTGKVGTSGRLYDYYG